MKTRLVVISPGLGLGIGPWEPLLKRLSEDVGWCQETTDFLRHESKTSAFGLRRLENLTQELVARIHAMWVVADGYEEIILVGHSMGGLIVRAAYLYGCGSLDSRLGCQAWSKAVVRIVLLAAPNRGINVLPWYARPFDWFQQRLPLPILTYQDLMRGSTFVTNLRITWIRQFMKSSVGETLPQVVQLLGERDSIVKEDDSVDILAFPSGIYVNVPGASHDDIHHIEHTNGNHSSERYALIRSAVVCPEDLDVVPAAAHPASNATRVVFVLHGIRATQIDDWLLKTENAVRSIFPVDAVVLRPSYGYFTALRFALPAVRRKNIRKFQDLYTETLARNPTALPDFIGHSNGTYMLGQSLLEIPAMRFGRVVLAGSVLPPDYPWDELLNEQRIERVRSDRGQRDWPVGWLCSALNRGFFMKDVGTGGYTGFERGEVIQERYHPGGHGGMFTEENIPRMARFLLGEDPGPELPHQVPVLLWWSFVSRLMQWVPLVLVLGCLFAGSTFGVLPVLAILVIVYLILDLI